MKFKINNVTLDDVEQSILRQEQLRRDVDHIQADLIRKAKELSGLTWTKFAESMGYSIAYYLRLAGGPTNLRMPLALAAALFREIHRLQAAQAYQEYLDR